MIKLFFSSFSEFLWNVAKFLGIPIMIIVLLVNGEPLPVWKIIVIIVLSLCALGGAIGVILGGISLIPEILETQTPKKATVMIAAYFTAIVIEGLVIYITDKLWI